MQMLLKDFYYGAKTLFRKPGFTALTVIILALGIGANTAIFSVVNRVLLYRLISNPPTISGRLGEIGKSKSSGNVARKF